MNLGNSASLVPFREYVLSRTSSPNKSKEVSVFRFGRCVPVLGIADRGRVALDCDLVNYRESAELRPINSIRLP